MNLLEQSADVRDQRWDEASQKLLARGEMHLPHLRPLPSLVTWSPGHGSQISLEAQSLTFYRIQSDRMFH